MRIRESTVKPTAVVIWITAILVILCCASLAAGFTKDYFIWDRDGNWNAAPAIEQALKKAKYSGDRNAQLPNLTALLDYRTVWICLGMYPDADPLINHPIEIGTLGSYLADNDSTCVYMEGGDAWYCDPWTSFHDYFHLRNWGHTGMVDLGTLMGQSSTFAEGMSFPYSGDDAFPDRLVIDSASTSFYLFKNDSPEYGLMIAYDNGACIYKTIASSCEFAGLTDGADPSTKIALVDSIMSFFCVPKVIHVNDVAVADIPTPTLFTPPHEAVSPSCEIMNVGSQPATAFNAHMRITPGSYEEMVFVDLLPPDSTVRVDFPDWTPGDVAEQYSVTAWTDWMIDQRRGNDTAYKLVTAWDDRWYIQSSWCYNDSVLPDGNIDTLVEWAGATVRDVSDFLGRAGNPEPPGSAYLYVMNDSLKLYLALDAIFDQLYSDKDAWETYFEDNFDQSWPAWPDSSEGGLAFHAHETQPWFEFTPLFSDFSALPYWVSIYGWAGASSGHMQYEYIIRFSDDPAIGDSIHPNLLADVSDTVGFWMLAGDGDQLAVYAWWPSSANIGWENLEDLGMIILSESLDTYSELEVVDILSPPDTVVIDSDYPVTVRIRNNGNKNEQGFWVGAVIGDTQPYIYADSVQAPLLGPDSTSDINLIPWHVTGNETTYTMCAYIAVTDSDTSNNRYCKDIDVVLTGVEELSLRRLPRVFSLSQNSPNPFARSTTMEYGLPRPSQVSIRVFDITGREIKILVNENLEPGFYNAYWDGRNARSEKAPSGVYFLKMDADTYSMTRKIVLLR